MEVKWKERPHDILILLFSYISETPKIVTCIPIFYPTIITSIN